MTGEAVWGATSAAIILVIRLLVSRNIPRAGNHSLTPVKLDLQPYTEPLYTPPTQGCFFPASQLHTLSPAVLAILWSAGELPTGQLPALASALLTDGYTSPALLQLAEAERSPRKHLRQLGDAAFHQFGSGPPLKRQAGRRTLAIIVAQQALASKRAVLVIGKLSRLMDYTTLPPANELVELNYALEFEADRNPLFDPTEYEQVARQTLARFIAASSSESPVTDEEPRPLPSQPPQGTA